MERSTKSVALYMCHVAVCCLPVLKNNDGFKAFRCLCRQDRQSVCTDKRVDVLIKKTNYIYKTNFSLLKRKVQIFFQEDLQSMSVKKSIQLQSDFTVLAAAALKASVGVMQTLQSEALQKMYDNYGR